MSLAKKILQEDASSPSFSEDKKIAYSFANPGPDGFGSVYDLGSNGYIISYLPKINEVIFHYGFTKILPYAKAIEAAISGEMLDQKEITILQPSTPFKVVDYKNFAQKD